MSEETGFVVLLEDWVWIAPCKGDPGRTCVQSNAKRFTSLKEARKALAWARTFRPFGSAKIEFVVRKQEAAQ